MTLNRTWLVKTTRRLCLPLLFFTIFCLYVSVPDRTFSGPTFHFEHQISNEVCSGSDDIFLLVLVHSAANHFRQRELIRATWARPGSDMPEVRVVFLLAESRLHQQEIERENIRHADIVQGTFVDAYRNLTLKHAMGLQWAARHCNRTKYLVKMDDDIFVDIYQLVNHLQRKIQPSTLENKIACYLQHNMPVVRDPVSKWFVSRREYPHDTFQDYCSGWAYVTTPRVARTLFETSQRMEFFWVDDVHFTGTVANRSNVGLVRMNGLFSLEADGLIEWAQSSEDLLWNKVFAPTWGDLELARRAHVKALACYVKRCKCCFARKTTPAPTTTVTAKGVVQLVGRKRIGRQKKKKTFKIK